jgi:hypothetical protein
MPVAARERYAMLQERSLLRAVLALVRRCDGNPPVPMLDAVLFGTSAVRPVLAPHPRSGVPLAHGTTT